jgi:hypothetical protein
VSCGALGHATDFCFAEVKHGGGQVCTHYLSRTNNGRGHFGVGRGYKSILFGNDLGPTRDSGVKPTQRV